MRLAAIITKEEHDSREITSWDVHEINPRGNGECPHIIQHEKKGLVSIWWKYIYCKVEVDVLAKYADEVIDRYLKSPQHVLISKDVDRNA